MHEEFLNSFHDDLTPWQSQILQLDAMILPDEKWTLESWQNVWNRNYQLHLFVQKDEVQAFALYQLIEFNPTWHLCKLVVAKNHQRQGLAGKLWDYQRKISPDSEIFLEVRVSNLNAINFYLKKSMTVVGLARGQYSNGESALRMIGPRYWGQN